MASTDIRALGVDFGEVRIGLALSDVTGTLASPLPTMRRRRGKRPPLKALQELGQTHDVTHLIVGLPLELDGGASEWTREVKRVGEALAERLGVPLHFVDERMTSVRAESAVRASGLPRRKREEKERVDAAAAALILQTWLDRRPPEGTVAPESSQSPDDGIR